MSRRAQRSKLCATPSKTRHATEAEAVFAGRSYEKMCGTIGRPFQPCFVYRCPCGAWHVTHLSVNKDTGRFNRKVNP